MSHASIPTVRSPLSIAALLPTLPPHEIAVGLLFAEARHCASGSLALWFTWMAVDRLKSVVRSDVHPAQHSIAWPDDGKGAENALSLHLVECASCVIGLLSARRLGLSNPFAEALMAGTYSGLLFMPFVANAQRFLWVTFPTRSPPLLLRARHAYVLKHALTSAVNALLFGLLSPDASAKAMEHVSFDVFKPVVDGVFQMAGAARVNNDYAVDGLLSLARTLDWALAQARAQRWPVRLVVHVTTCWLMVRAAAKLCVRALGDVTRFESSVMPLAALVRLFRHLDH